MPEETNPINQKLTLAIEEKIKGDDVRAHLKKVEKALQRAQKNLAKYDKQFEKHAKAIKRALPSVDRFTKQQTRLSKSVSGSLTPMRKQLDLLRKTRREMGRTTKMSQGLGRSMSRIAGLIGAGGLGYLALQRVKKMMDSRLNLAVTGGADQIKLIRSLTGGRNVTSAIDLMAKFQAQSPFARFGLGSESTKGMVALQRKMEPIGLDLANDLILGITKGLEPDKLRSFLQGAGSGNVRQALLGAASGSNVQAITSALNALEIGDLKVDNKLDPMLQAAVEFKTTGNRLADAFDKLSANLTQDLLPVIQSLTTVMEKIAGVVGGLSTKELIGYGVGGLTALELAKYGLKRGVGSLFGSLFGRGFPRGVPGMPPAGFGGGGGLRIPGMRPALPGRFIPPGGLGPNGFPVISPLRLPAGGAVGVGLAGAAAAGSVYTAVRSGQTAYAERGALEAIQNTQQDSRVFQLANRMKQSATTELDRLRAKRKSLDAMIGSTVGGTGIKKDFVGRMLGFYGNFPQADQKQLEQLREQRAAVQRQIQALQKQQPTSIPSIVTDVFDSIRSGLDKAKDAAEQFKSGMDNLVQKGLEANLKRLQQQAARREHLALTATEQGALTQLSRLEFDIARTTPFGTIGAMGQFLVLQKQLNREIQSLTEVMNNIDISTQQGRIESARLNAQIKSLRLEEKQRGLEMTKAMMSSIQAQAFNVGKFEKIIITQEKNVRKGLQMGVVKAFSPITGVTGQPSRGRKPVKLNPANSAIEATDNLARAAKDLSGYLQNIIGEDEPTLFHPGNNGYATIN